MAYVTRHFTHLETLERARRWLVQAGIHPSRIEVHTQGSLRIRVMVEPGQAVEVESVLDAAESSDPDGNPSFWDVARQQHVYPEQATPGPTPTDPHSQSYVVGWRPLDADREITQASTETELEKAYRDQRE
jgi:hypothetical protein